MTRHQPAMSDDTVFSRSALATVTVDGQPIGATKPQDTRTVAMIPAQPATHCMARLMGAIDAGQEFCIHGAPAPVPAPSRGAFLQCETSGSTGAPKRIRRSQASWIRSFKVDRDMWDITADDCIAVFGPLSHSLALYGAVLGQCLQTKVAIIAAPRPDVRRQLLTKAQPTLLYTTPAQLRQLTVGMDESFTSDSLRHVFVGGGFMDDAARSAAEQMFPYTKVHAFYGASETSFVTISSADTPPLSAGRPYPRVQVTIRDADGRSLPTGECGDVWISSPYLFDGYEQGASAQTRWRSGALTVGELGWLDEKGYLFLAGRRDRMFTVADRNVYPELIEQFLLSQPGITQAAVLPVADGRRGSVPICYLHAPSNVIDSNAILKACRRAFGAEAAPRRARLLEVWPTLTSGKTDLDALARLIGEKT